MDRKSLKTSLVVNLMKELWSGCWWMRGWTRQVYLHVQQRLENRQVEGEAVLLDVTGPYWTSGPRNLAETKTSWSHCSRNGLDFSWGCLSPGFYHLEVAQPAGEVQDVSQVCFGVSGRAGGRGPSELLGDGVQLQRTKSKDLALLKQLLACRTSTDYSFTGL